MEKYEYQIDKECVPSAIGEQIMGSFLCGHRGHVGFVCVQEGIGVFKSEKEREINVTYMRVYWVFF